MEAPDPTRVPLLDKTDKTNDKPKNHNKTINKPKKSPKVKFKPILHSPVGFVIVRDIYGNEKNIGLFVKVRGAVNSVKITEDSKVNSSKVGTMKSLSLMISKNNNYADKFAVMTRSTKKHNNFVEEITRVVEQIKNYKSQSQ